MNEQHSEIEIERLRRENEALRQENERLKKELERVTEEFENYKIRHPWSVGVKHGKPYVLKSSIESWMPKKPGAKPGHPPHIRPLPQHIDEVCLVPVTRCPECGGTELSEEVQEVRERIYEDIPICKSLAIQLKIERRYCRTCRKLVETPVSVVLPGARLGLRVMLVVVWFKIKLRMTEAAIPEVLYRLFGLKISEGEVIHILSQMAEAFGPYYQQLIDELRAASARNIDETIWRINGSNVRLWAFVTKWVTVYTIASSRAHTVPLQVLGKKHQGVDVHDRFSAYKTLARKTGNVQQDCWTHIICDAKELVQFYEAEGAHVYQVVKEIYERAKAYDHRGTEEDIERLFQDMAEMLDRPYQSQHCYRFVVNLLLEKENLFEFVKNPEVDGTNSAAERAIRPPVVARKISGGSRSYAGAKNYEILLSVVQTLRQNEKNLLDHGSAILLTSHG